MAYTIKQELSKGTRMSEIIDIVRYRYELPLKSACDEVARVRKEWFNAGKN